MNNQSIRTKMADRLSKEEEKEYYKRKRKKKVICKKINKKRIKNPDSNIYIYI